MKPVLVDRLFCFQKSTLFCTHIVRYIKLNVNQLNSNFIFLYKLNFFFARNQLVFLTSQLLKSKTMFTKENGKKFVVVLAAVMVGLAAHQAFIAPMIAKKQTPKA